MQQAGKKQVQNGVFFLEYEFCMVFMYAKSFRFVYQNTMWDVSTFGCASRFRTEK